MMKQPRRTPLPWQTAKSAEDDPQAPQRLAAILRSPSYLPGDADPAFLQREDTRSQRLQLDYLKPELLLEAAGIRPTVVVFGSTPIRMCRRNCASAFTTSPCASSTSCSAPGRWSLFRAVSARSMKCSKP